MYIFVYVSVYLLVYVLAIALGRVLNTTEMSRSEKVGSGNSFIFAAVLVYCSFLALCISGSRPCLCVFLATGHK